MSDNQPLDLIVKNVRVVRPNQEGVVRRDLGIRDGRFVEIAEEIAAAPGTAVYDARGLLGFPGAIDAHTHVGIYKPAAADAPTESASAVSGGVTVLIPYVRTGSLYLYMGGSWRDFFPELLRQSAGRYYTDYAFHVSPIRACRFRKWSTCWLRRARPISVRCSCSTGCTGCTAVLTSSITG